MKGIMKKIILILTLFLGATPLFADTNNITALIQRGLFEEEANHNLPAAMEAYQSAISEHDKDRKLVATAIFRLGECYRKQGKTAEANTQYQRIVSEFPDQPQLVSLSRQNLGSTVQEPVTAVTSNPTVVNNVSPEIKVTQALYEETIRKALEAENVLRQIVGMSYKERLNFFTITKPDEKLVKLVELLEGQKGELNSMSTNDPAYLTGKKIVSSTIDKIQTYMDEKYDAVSRESNSLKRLEADLKAKLKELTAASAPQKAAIPAAVQSTNSSAIATVIDEEQAELEHVKKTIKDSPDLINSFQYSSAGTALQNAANQGYIRVAEFILKNGGDPNVGYKQRHPLILAVSSGHKAMVELLLSNGADIKVKNEIFQTPLDIAVGNGFQSIAEVLLKAGADPNEKSGNYKVTPLFATTLIPGKTSTTLAQLLLDHKADVNASNTEGVTALMYASLHPNTEIAKFLIDHKADVNATNNKGETALTFAVLNNNTEIAKLLIDHKADVNVVTEEGVTAILIAAFQSDLDMAKLLLANGADPNKTGEIKYVRRFYVDTIFHSTALANAIARNYLDMVNALLDAHADPNKTIQLVEPNRTQKRTITPLFLSLSKPKIVETLLAHGANPNLSQDGKSLLSQSFNYDTNITLLLLRYKASAITTNDTRPLLFMAIDLKKAELIEPLYKAGADINQKFEGQTPLFYATIRNNLEAVKALLACKANPNIVDDKGNAPIEFTKREPQELDARVKLSEIAKLLRAAGATDEYLNHKTIWLKNSKDTTPLIERSQYGRIRWELADFIDMACAKEKKLLNQSFSGKLNKTRDLTFEEMHNIPWGDISKIKIQRRNQDGSTNVIDVNFLKILEDGDRSKDPLLEWGDVVEVPKAEDKTPNWTTNTQVISQFCRLTYRHIKVNSCGIVSKYTLLPHLASKNQEVLNDSTIIDGTPVFCFEITEFYSELKTGEIPMRGVRIISIDPETKTSREFTVNANPYESNRVHYYLQDGDQILLK